MVASSSQQGYRRFTGAGRVLARGCADFEFQGHCWPQGGGLTEVSIDMLKTRDLYCRGPPAHLPVHPSMENTYPVVERRPEGATSDMNEGYQPS